MDSPDLHSVHGLKFAELQARMAGLRPIHARTLWKAIHRAVEQPVTQRADFPPPLRRWIAAQDEVALQLPEIERSLDSSDGLTRKLLVRLRDGETVETVVMGYDNRFTACISTQVGCAMGCVFCATGQMGFKRHLLPGEIVSQVLLVERELRARRKQLRNLVLMGMGEPLHNYEAVLAALEILSDRHGMALTPRRITISTVGVVPGILRLAQEQRPYNLAVSLHAATDAERSALVPANKRWPLGDILSACRVYNQKIGRKIFFEWTLIAGTNDTPEQARLLGSLLKGLNAHVNLIPLNPTEGYRGEPTHAEAAKAFQHLLREAGFPSTVRQRRGIDVAAGCGQLRRGFPKP